MPSNLLAPAAAAYAQTNRGGIASSSRPVTARPALPTVTRTRSKPRRLVLAASEPVTLNKAPMNPITLTDAALTHLKKLRGETSDAKTVLRVGVKSGGCSGMSYVMDFITKAEDMRPEDTVIPLEDGIELRVDPKSLLYLFGLHLDYSSDLIGGGFKFMNPNAASSCGCGTSFNV